jgi:hypothetical protein
MSLFHRLILGHFDVGAFVPHRPVPLRPLDDRRTRAMLEEIGERISEDQYDVDGEALYFVDGYCDCPWLSSKHNEKSERFARTVAAVEDCFLIETGAGTILNPVRSLQAVPSGLRPAEGRSSAPLSLAEAEVIAQGGDPGDLSQVVLRAAAGDGDWLQGFCASLARHAHFHVRGNALFALGMLALSGNQLTREVIQPTIEGALTDPVPYVAGQARFAAEAVEKGLKWVIHSFDNGNLEMDVSTYSNGWVRCPNCGLRFATYDPWAFREGRCMTCRQRLRVMSGGEEGICNGPPSATGL